VQRVGRERSGAVVGVNVAVRLDNPVITSVENVTALLDTLARRARNVRININP